MTAPSTDRELLPCPFCGDDKVHVCVTRFDAEQRDAYAVSCRTRDCAGVIFTLGFGLFDSAEKAIAAWNRRADLTAAESLKRRVGELEGALNGLLINCPNCGGMGQVETGAIQRGVPFWRDCGYCASARKVYDEAKEKGLL